MTRRHPSAHSRKHPAIEAELVHSDARQDLASGDTEVALRVGHLGQLDYRARRLGSLRELRVTRAGNPDRAIVLPWQERLGANASESVRVTSVTAARAAVIGGLGWALLPEPILRHVIDPYELRVESESRAVPVYAVHAFGAKAPSQVAAFIEAAVKVVRDTDSGSR